MNSPAGHGGSIRRLPSRAAVAWNSTVRGRHISLFSTRYRRWDGPERSRIIPLLRLHAPTWCLQLPSVFGSSGTIEQLQRDTIGATKERMVREMSDALGVIAAASPIVLLLEDLHWADSSTVDLLRHVFQRIGGQRLLVLATLRPEDRELTNHPLRKYKLEIHAHQECDEVALRPLQLQHIAA